MSIGGFNALNARAHGSEAFPGCRAHRSDNKSLIIIASWAFRDPLI